jgi:hypothetical protein
VGLFWKHASLAACRAAKPSFISMAHSLWRAIGHVSALEPTSKAGVSAGPLLSGEVGSDAEGHVVALDPSWMAGRGPEILGMWQLQSPPRQRGGVQSLGHVAGLEPSLSREAGSGATVARGTA